MANWSRARFPRFHSGWWLPLILFLAACGPAAAPAAPTAAAPLAEAVMRYETMTLEDGTAVTYALVLPAGFTSGQPYPTLLALPPGGQTKAMVEAGLGYWQAQAEARGWVVVSPIAPGGTLFFQGSEALLPGLMDKIEEIVTVENGRFHLAGVSNGGISAFRIAAMEPDRFQSMLVVPGLPGTDADFARLDKLADLPIAMFVGENDTTWLARMQAAETELRRLGAEVSLEIVPGEGHVIQSLGDGVRFYDFFDAHR